MIVTKLKYNRLGPESLGREDSYSRSLWKKKIDRKIDKLSFSSTKFEPKNHLTMRNKKSYCSIIYPT